MCQQLEVSIAKMICLLTVISVQQLSLYYYDVHFNIHRVSSDIKFILIYI
jgi:hypothetical protein